MAARDKPAGGPACPGDAAIEQDDLQLNRGGWCNAKGVAPYALALWLNYHGGGGRKKSTCGRQGSDYIPRMIHGSNTPRTDLSTYLRCLLEAVRRMLGGRWGFLMRPVAGLLMGREARQALLQAAAAFEQLAVLLEQFRAGTLVPEGSPSGRDRGDAAHGGGTAAHCAAGAAVALGRQHARIARPRACAAGEGCIHATGRILATHVGGLPLMVHFSRRHGRLCGRFSQKWRFGPRGYCVHFVALSKLYPTNELAGSGAR